MTITMDQKTEPKPPESKKRGRPIKYRLPPPIPCTPEKVAMAILASPPKKRSEWRFIQEMEGK